MNAGRLRHRIEIEHTEKVRKGDFGEEITVTRRFSTRADIRHDRGVRVEENGEIIHSYDVTFIVWKYIYSMVSEYDTVIWRGRRYRFVSLEPDDQNMILHIRASLENE